MTRPFDRRNMELELNNGDRIRVSAHDGESATIFVVIDGRLVNPENGVSQPLELMNALRSALRFEKV